MSTDTSDEAPRPSMLPDPEAWTVPLGNVYITANAERTLPPVAIILSLDRHARGDWGETCDEDRQANDDALKNGGRLLSVYRTKDGTKFWIITEADRSATTVLLPEDY